MYRLEVHSKLFSGKSLVQQHRMVQEILKDEIKDMHGLTMTTKAIKE
jgi:stress-induced morphogen